MSASDAQVTRTVGNDKARREAVRIGWRRWVLEQPGGVEFLCGLVRVREQDIGPHKYAFPAVTP